MKLGGKAKDKITGFSGTITAKCEYLTGCTQYLLQPGTDKDGKYVDGRWMDEDRLEAIEADPVMHQVNTKGACDPAPIK